MTDNFDADESLREAVALHQEGRLDRAQALYENLLERNIENSGAWHYYGILCHQRGDSDTGVKFIYRALDLNPQDASAWNNLGNVLMQIGQIGESAQAYLEALKIDPVYAEAFGNLGIAFMELQMVEDARKALVRAIELKPDFLRAYLALGQLSQIMKNWGNAVGCLRKAIALAPEHSDAHRALWRILFMGDRPDEAKEALENWLSHDPDNPYALHLMAAQTGENVPKIASEGYVRMLFDSFAASFDFLLREKLDYQAPEHVAEAARLALAGRDEVLKVADLGCGTGLCGPLLKPMAGFLAGVDLSRNMLEKAQGRGVYDLLVQAELTDFLGESTRSYDALVSADTLVYFGDLGTFAEKARLALRPRGVLVFTVEKAGDAQTEGYHLQSHGRFTHRGDYLDEVFGSAGFEIERKEVFLRNEGEAAVSGWLVTALLRG